MRVLPAAQLDEPVLQDHRRELGIHLAQDAPGFFTAPLIEIAMLFPQPEQTLDLPAQAQEHHHLLGAESTSRHIGQDDGPIGQPEHLLIRGAPMRLGNFADMCAPLLGHPQHDDAHGQSSGLTHERSHFHHLTHLLGEDPCQCDAMAPTRLQDGLGLIATDKVALDAWLVRPPTSTSHRTNSLMAAGLAPPQPPQPRHTSASSLGSVMLELSSRITALNCLSSAISTGSTCICSAHSRSSTRCNKVAASGVKRWLSPEAEMLTSRRSSTCVSPSSVISGSCNQPRISVWTKSLPLITRCRSTKPTSRASCSTSSPIMRCTVSAKCVIVLIGSPSSFMQNL